MKFNDNLRKLREKAGFSQVELAEKVGIPFQTINRYENTDIIPRIDVVARIAQVLMVSVDELVVSTDSFASMQTLVTEVAKFSKVLDSDIKNKKIEVVCGILQGEYTIDQLDALNTIVKTMK